MVNNTKDLKFLIIVKTAYSDNKLNGNTGKDEF